MKIQFFQQIRGYLVVAVTLTMMPAQASIPGANVLRNDANANAGVLPPVSSAYGHTYAEWSERWWLWYIPQTVTSNAITDCALGQSGEVWFLEAFGSTCTVPAGKALFFPVVDAECSSLESAPFFGGSPADRSACAKALIDDTSNLAAEIDGISVQNLMAYRFQTPDFNFTAPADNLNGIPPGSGQSTADGYYLMLAPLPVGLHTIHFKGTFNAFGFTIDATYHLLVK